jgi:D-alanyl-D-alanine carboxypeptidase
VASAIAASQPAAEIKPGQSKLAAAAPPPQLKPAAARQEAGVADGVMPLAANRNWGIQVGAYSRYSPARQAAIKAQQSLPFEIPQTRIAVDESEGRNGKLYRARLVGLGQDEATDACRALKARHLSCLVVQSNLAVAENSTQ